MNFLFHLHLAARDLGSPAAGAGAMLPDLWRMADRRVRARKDPGAMPEGTGSAALDDVLAGIAHHLRVDRWFHHDAVFLDGEREAAARIREAKLAAPRSTLFAHVLWEMCLDGALLEREGLAAMLSLAHEGIAALAVAGERAADIHHFDRARGAANAGAREAFAGRMAHILTELGRGPWIEGYRRGEGIALRVQGVRRGLGLAPMDAGDLTRLADVADALVARAPEVVERIEAAVPGR